MMPLRPMAQIYDFHVFAKRYQMTSKKSET